MADNITRCPKCHTSFRITDAHLKTAKGSVRCGSCLTIFNAIDHLTIAPQKASPNFEEKISEQDKDILISDDMDSGSNEAEESFSEEFNQEILSSSKNNDDFSLFERDSIKDDDPEDESHDDSWALKLLEEDDSNEAPDEQHETEESFSNTDPFASAIEGLESADEQTLQDPEIDYEEFYHADKFKIVEEEPEDNEVEEIDYTDSHFDNQSSQSVTHGLSAQFLDSIEPEPVEFAWVKSNPIWHSKLLWGSLSTLAGLLMFFQIAWIKFDDWSRNEAYRGYYQQACHFIGCEVPQLVDTKAISARNLIVRSNSTVENSLVVDFILQNGAFFEQPFPGIALSFTDHQNTLIAYRCFKPSEYLGGELTGKKNMPVRQPIHIAIDITDPGENATGYKINICQ